MANNKDNLISLADRSPEERKEIARKGGVRSGTTRKQRRTLREELLAILSEGDNQERMCTAIFARACEGDKGAFDTIRDTIGEKPKDEISVESNTITVTIDD